MAARGGGFGGGPVAADRASFKTVQGGALRTFHFDHAVDSVQVILTTEGRPLEAKVELLQGPNNVKKAIDLYTEDGYRRQFSCVLETPGDSYVVQITNTAPIEFPISASVVPLSIGRGGMSPYNNQWGYGRGQGGMSPYNDQWGYGRGGRGYGRGGPGGGYGPYGGGPGFDEPSSYGGPSNFGAALARSAPGFYR
mmetsp:Transcript_88738/g.266963  ORF Transcript_88738/g.266963 Transcript_88738/m.266963 type:complete len:195 (+) Transcript_88738:1-585(+)